LLVLDGEAPEEVPLDDAFQSLKGLLAYFDFVTQSDLSRALASFLTPAMKMGGLLQGHVPITVAEADESQSGKGLLQKMLAAIYGETPSIAVLKRGGVGGADESFFEKLVNGRPFIQLDNYRGVLDSPALESFLTADRCFPCRIPLVREIEVDPSRFFILLTSNGVETTRDLANRSNIVRIRKRHGIDFPDTLSEIRSRQPYYLGCVFAIIREWHRLGKPQTNETRHDFRGWCRPLDWISQNLWRLPPLMDGHQSAQERVSNPALTFLRKIAVEVGRAGSIGVPLSASEIYDLAERANLEIPGLGKNGVLDEERGKRIIGIKFAPLFKDAAVIDLDGLTVTRKEESRSRSGGGNYSVNTYTFGLPQQSQQPSKA
jgi:hypothetical protein